MASTTITCNCPDFQASRLADPSAPFLSQQTGGDWSASGAGMKNNNRYCKHIIRALMLSGTIKDWDGLAGILGYNTADFPTPNAIKYRTIEPKPRLNKNPRLGDDFS